MAGKNGREERGDKNGGQEWGGKNGVARMGQREWVGKNDKREGARFERVKLRCVKGYGVGNWSTRRSGRQPSARQEIPL